MAKIIDMTKGRPFKLILAFSIPLAISAIVQQLYSFVDALIVSFSLGAEVATGVNLTGSITFLFYGITNGLASGFGVLLAKFVGAGDNDSLKKGLANAITLCVIIGLTVAVVGVLTTTPVLRLLGTDQKYMPFAVEYLACIYVGAVFTMLYNLAKQVLTSLGDSRTPLVILFVSAVINLGLDCLMFLPGFTVGWAAWATVISQGVSAIIAFGIAFARFPAIRPKSADFRLLPKMSLGLLGIGLPMAIQFAVTAAGSMIQQSAFNALGPDVAMAQGAGSRVDSIFICAYWGVALTMATYAGQNYGARNAQRLKQGFRDSLLVGAIYVGIFMSLGLIFARVFPVLLLPGQSEEIYDIATRYVRTQALFHVFLMALYLSREPVQAMGMSGAAMLCGVAELIARTVAALTFLPHFGAEAAGFSNPLAWASGALVGMIIQAFRLKALTKEFGGEPKLE